MRYCSGSMHNRVNGIKQQSSLADSVILHMETCAKHKAWNQRVIHDGTITIFGPGYFRKIIYDTSQLLCD